MRFCFIFISALILQPALAQDHSDWANLKRYREENTLLMKDKNPGNRVVFIGNSITQGWKDADPAFFKDNPYINRGISGQTTPQMLIRFRPDVINLRPAVVVILAGINDIAENTGPMTPEETYGNIISMVELARANNIRVIISSVLPANTFPWRPHIYPADKVIELNKMLKAYCEKEKVYYLDYYTSMVDDRKGLKKEYTTDGVHCTPEGYGVMRSLAQPAIQAELSSK